jgi:hypothetical protein
LSGRLRRDFGKFGFGRIEIDGATYERDVVIDRDRIRKRKKKLSKIPPAVRAYPGFSDEEYPGSANAS